jgi:hypothetical protein
MSLTRIARNSTEIRTRYLPNKVECYCHLLTCSVSESCKKRGFESAHSCPSAKRTKDLLRLNRDQLRWVVILLTGHCHLKGHVFKMGLTDDPICERCLEDDESATHVLCDCEALAKDFVTWVSSLWTQVTIMAPP